MTVRPDVSLVSTSEDKTNYILLHHPSLFPTHSNPSLSHLRHRPSLHELSIHSLAHLTHLKKFVIGSSALLVCACLKNASCPSHLALGHVASVLSTLDQAREPPRMSSGFLGVWRWRSK